MDLDRAWLEGRLAELEEREAVAQTVAEDRKELLDAIRSDLLALSEKTKECYGQCCYWVLGEVADILERLD